MILRQNHDPFARQSAGFTLIEVVVGLVLLATLCVGLLLALARHQRSNELAGTRYDATLIADQMLASWIDSPAGIPLSASGRVAGRPTWAWRTSVLSNRMVFGIPAVVVRLDIFRDQVGPALISVETVVAAPKI